MLLQIYKMRFLIKWFFLLYFCAMNKMTKTFGIFFVAVIFLLNLSISNYGLLLNTQIQTSQNENSDSYISAQNLDLYFSNRNEKQPAYSVRNLPVSNLKNQPDDLYSDFHSVEGRISDINAGYLGYAVTLDPNLSNREIVFPFHYFW